MHIGAAATTEFILDYITEKGAIYITNAINLACRLAHMGCEIHLAGGKLKNATKAIIGAETTEMLSQHNFTIGFWGTNGIHKKTGHTTLDREEAGVKYIVLCNCKRRHIVAGSSKFDSISPVRFAKSDNVVIITDKIAEGYGDCVNIIIAE